MSQSEDTAVNRLFRVSDWAMSRTDGLLIPSNPRSFFGAASYHLAMEYHRAIGVLAKESLHGAMASLLRPAVESFLRGAWLTFLARDDEVSQFKSRGQSPSLQTLLKKVDKGRSIGPSKKALQELLAAMNNVTHGGNNFLARRRNGAVIVSHFPPEIVRGFLEMSSIVAINSALDIVGGILGDESAHQQMMEEAKALISGG